MTPPFIIMENVDYHSFNKYLLSTYLLAFDFKKLTIWIFLKEKEQTQNKQRIWEKTLGIRARFPSLPTPSTISPNPIPTKNNVQAGRRGESRGKLIKAETSLGPRERTLHPLPWAHINLRSPGGVMSKDTCDHFPELLPDRRQAPRKEVVSRFMTSELPHVPA